MLQSHHKKLWHFVAFCGILWHFVVVAFCGCGILWHFVAYCGDLWHFVAFCGVLWHFMAFCCVLWHFVVICGILWPFVAYCGVGLHLLHLLVLLLGSQISSSLFLPVETNHGQK